MAFEKDNTYSVSDFIALKNRVKAEMNRRNGHGSLTSYGSSTYDYNQPPSPDETVDNEHYDKIRDVQAKINPNGLLPIKNSDDIIEEMTVLEAKQTAFEAQSRGARNNNDCNGACSGMCVTACTTSCSGSCSGGCTSCTGCSGGCSGCSGCGGSCSNSCSGCSGGCSGSCSGCSGSCSGGCSGCSGSCSGGCSGCTARCGGNCTADCGSGCFWAMTTP